jgi:hypothetical protein
VESAGFFLYQLKNWQISYSCCTVHSKYFPVF